MTVTRLQPSPNELDAPDGCVTSIQLVRRAGITYRQLDYWTRTDLLTPLPRPLVGGVREPTSGTPRYFPSSQVERATVLRLLLDAGFSLQTCRNVIDDFVEQGSIRLNDHMTLHLATDL